MTILPQDLHGRRREPAFKLSSDRYIHENTLHTTIVLGFFRQSLISQIPGYLGTCFVNQAGLKFTEILLPLALECWD